MIHMWHFYEFARKKRQKSLNEDDTFITIEVVVVTSS